MPALTNETRAAGTVRVRRYNIIGTSMWAYVAYEPVTQGPLTPRHSTTTTIGGYWYGTIPSRPLPPELAALPAHSDERYERVTAWQAANYLEALGHIRALFPETQYAYATQNGEALLREEDLPSAITATI
jgi:hypothetical protein